MDIDLDKKLYNDYLNGKVEAFEALYLKYKDKLKYFIFGIVKDYEKAEDITQDVFIYILKNKYEADKSSFKYYLYLIAKSKAINVLNTDKRRNNITEQYLEDSLSDIEEDALEVITKEENKKELIEAISLIDEKYRNAIYLANIEDFSYQETADILGLSIQDVKNYIHRGKKELRKILIKKGYQEMNKVSKILIIIICTSVVLSGIVYATTKIYENIKGKVEMTPTYTSKISTIDTNKVWVGTFNLVWNDLMDDVIGHKIEFEDGYSELANELNKQSFTTSELSENSYYKINGESTFELKEKIEKGIKEKFNENSQVLDKVEWGNPNSYTLYAMLKKEFNYLEKFPTLPDDTFGTSSDKVKYFGIDASTKDDAKVNVEVLFYNSKKDFAVKLKTKENEEVILCKGTGEGKSFEEIYKEIEKNRSNYNGEKTFQKNDVLKIPFIKINDEINYDELCGRMIKGTQWYIKQALQTIDFELNNYGGSVKSEALIEILKSSDNIDRDFSFDSDFVIFLKEKSKNKPYFALKVDNTDVLEMSTEN